MSDISITITADPTQAVNGIKEVSKSADDMAKSVRRSNQEATQGGSSAVGQVLSVSQQAQSSVGQTISAVGNLSGSVKKLGRDASAISGALGESVPVIGRIGSALAAVMTGPVGLISAAIAAAGAAIQKIIADAEARVARLRASVDARSSAAYDQLVEGRKEYQAALDTLAKVRELNALAKQSPLQADELAAFRSLAGQIGIREKDVTASGINPYRLQEAEQRLASDRASAAKADMQQYTAAFKKQLAAAIESSDLSEGFKRSLSGMKLSEQIQYLQQASASGIGLNAGDVKAFSDLYKMTAQYTEARDAYRRDPLLGRDRSDLNAEAVDLVRSGVSGRVQDAEDRKRMREKIYAAANAEAAAIEAAAKKEQDDIDEKEKAAARLNQGLERQIEIQQLINEGKQKEAFVLQNRMRIEDAYGRALTEAEAAENERLAATLYDLQHPASPSPEPDGAPRASSARQAAASVRYDRLQRIGANVSSAAVSPEKLVMDKQLTVQEQIRNILQAAAITHPETNIMRF